MAARAERLDIQQLHRDAERRWTSLAHSYELTGRILRSTAYLAEQLANHPG